MDFELKNEYTKIPNEVFEIVAKAKLNGTQFRILLVVWRLTYGWNRKASRISETLLAKKTNIVKQQIQRELKAMIQMGVLVEVEKPTVNSSRLVAYNEKFMSVAVECDIDSLSEIDVTPGNKIDVTPGNKIDVTPGNKIDVYKRNTTKRKEKKKDELVDYERIFKHHQSLELVKHRSLTVGAKSAIDKAMKELNCSEDDLVEMLTRHKESVENTKDSEYPVKARSLSEFFGQRVFNGTDLICAKYNIEGWKCIAVKSPISNDGRKVGQIPTRC